MTTEERKTVNVLLIEDNPGDVRLAREALRNTEIQTRLHVAKDGEEAMAYLKEHLREGQPDLIILDLNLPLKDGREVLAEIKETPGMKQIPVVILTTSKAPEDVRHAYDLHANCFVTKAIDWERSCQIVESIESFWLRTVTLPPKGI